jgi:hypothetical protein
LIRGQHDVAEKTTASLELANGFAHLRLFDFENPNKWYASYPARTIHEFVGVSLTYASDLRITCIVPSLTDDRIVDSLNSFPTLRLLEHDYLVVVIDVANSLFASTR